MKHLKKIKQLILYYKAAKKHIFSIYIKFFVSSSESGVSESPPNGKRPSPSPTKPSESGEGNTRHDASTYTLLKSPVGNCHLLYSRVCVHLYRVHSNVHLREQRTGRPEFPARRYRHGDQERRGLVDGHGRRQDWSLSVQLRQTTGLGLGGEM